MTSRLSTPLYPLVLVACGCGPGAAHGSLTWSRLVSRSPRWRKGPRSAPSEASRRGAGAGASSASEADERPSGDDDQPHERDDPADSPTGGMVGELDAVVPRLEGHTPEQVVDTVQPGRPAVDGRMPPGVGDIGENELGPPIGARRDRNLAASVLRDLGSSRRGAGGTAPAELWQRPLGDEDSAGVECRRRDGVEGLGLACDNLLAVDEPRPGQGTIVGEDRGVGTVVGETEPGQSRRWLALLLEDVAHAEQRQDAQRLRVE